MGKTVLGTDLSLFFWVSVKIWWGLETLKKKEKNNKMTPYVITASSEKVFSVSLIW